MAPSVLTLAATGTWRGCGWRGVAQEGFDDDESGEKERGEGSTAALIDDPVWVMNSVPVAAKVNTLGAIYEHGLIGTYMKWYVISSIF